MNRNDQTIRMILAEVQDRDLHPFGCVVTSSNPDYTATRLGFWRKQMGLTHLLTISRRANDEIWIVHNAQKE